MEWYLKVVRDNYANFNGRARRKEYWMFTLFNIIIVIALGLVGGLLGSLIGSETGGVIGLAPVILYTLAIIVPTLAVSARRLMDQDKSPWLLLLQLIPLGGLVLLVFFCLEGTKGANKYGADPKGGESIF